MKTVSCVIRALIELLYNVPLHSITSDRGKEFAKHAEVSKVLGVEFYFPEAGQAWQWGNE